MKSNFSFLDLKKCLVLDFAAGIKVRFSLRVSRALLQFNFQILIFYYINGG